MKKLILNLVLIFSSLNLINAEDVISRAACAPCNPCVPTCMITGVFQAGNAVYYEGPVILQNGCKFIVTAGENDGQYIVTFLTPFCSPVAVVASSTSGLVTVDAQDEAGFVLGNILAGDTVYFVAAPTISK